MKFFTVSEILISIFFSAISGILFGGIYCASESIFLFLKEMILIFPMAVKLSPDISLKNIINKIKSRKKICLGSIERNVFEAIMFFFFGIVMILISYATLDGYIRFYIFIVTALFFILSRKYIGKLSSAVLERIFRAIYFITIIFISVLIWPLYKVLNKLTPLVKRVVMPAVYSIRKKRSERILKAKLREISKVMKLNT